MNKWKESRSIRLKPNSNMVRTIRLFEIKKERFKKEIWILRHVLHEEDVNPNSIPITKWGKISGTKMNMLCLFFGGDWENLN